MHKSKIRLLILGLACAVVALPLHAQMLAPQTAAPETREEPAAQEETIAKVRTDEGVIMISEGGQFLTAEPGQRVASNARLMVSRESAATVIYDNGCEQEYDKPGIYEISSDCVVAAAPAAVATAGGSSTTGWIAASVVMAGVAAYVILDDNDGNGFEPPPPPPVSP